jgi:hypothetical protein
MTKRAFADLVAAACQQPKKQFQPPASFFQPESGQRKAAEQLRGEILRAQRYILDDDVVEAAVDLGVQHPEIVLAVLKSAMAPFDTMWIEWSPHAQMRAALANLGEKYTPKDMQVSQAGVLIKRIGDTRYRMSMIGECLLYGDDATTKVKGARQFGPSTLAVEYDVQNPLYGGTLGFAEQMIERYTPADAGYIRTALLGGAYMQPKALREELIAEMREEEGLTDHQIEIRLVEIVQQRVRQCDTLVSHAQWVFDPFVGKTFLQNIEAGPGIDARAAAIHDHSKNTLGLSVREEAGAFRFVIAVIALMTGRDRLVGETLVNRAQSSAFVAGKRVPFLENRRVSLTVPRKIANKRILRALSKQMPRAQHDVEGHWKQRRKGFDINCDHVMVWETPKREVCAIEGCGFKRWRVEEFQRGDPAIGVIRKTRVAQLDRKVQPIPTITREVYGD